MAIIGAFFFLKESLPPEKRAVARPPVRRGHRCLQAGGAAACPGQLLAVGFLAYLAMAAFETNFPLGR